jgi:hypothetical protein
MIKVGIYLPVYGGWFRRSVNEEERMPTNVSHTTLCEAFRYPAVLAKQAATLSDVSDGRFWLSIGAGWFRREYEA